MPPTKATDLPKLEADLLAAVLDTITAKAPGLRDAGLLDITVGSVQFKLAPPEVKLEEPDKKTNAPPSDPFRDPATFGRRDGYVPGFGDPEGFDELMGR